MLAAAVRLGGSHGLSRPGSEHRPLTPYEHRVEGVGDALIDWGHARRHAIEAARQVVLGLERVRQQVVVVRAIVGGDLGAGVAQNQCSSLLQHVQSAVGGYEVVVVAAHEDPEPLVGNPLAQLHPCTDGRRGRTSLTDARLGTAYHDEVDLPLRREFAVSLGKVRLGKCQLTLIVVDSGGDGSVSICP